MTEYAYKEQKPCPQLAKPQEKSTEKEIERPNEDLAKTTAEDALIELEKLSQENALLHEKLKIIEKVYKKYDYVEGYMEKYGANTDMELDMWQAIKQVIKGKMK